MSIRFTLLAAGFLGLTTLACRVVPRSEKTSVEDHLAAAVRLQENGDFTSALQQAQEAVRVSPQMTKAHFVLATIADDICIPNAQPGPRNNSCELAVQEYKRTLELDSNHLDALRNLAYLLYEFDRLDESEFYYRRDLTLHPDDPSALAGIAAIDYPQCGRSGANLVFVERNGLRRGSREESCAAGRRHCVRNAGSGGQQKQP